MSAHTPGPWLVSRMPRQGIRDEIVAPADPSRGLYSSVTVALVPYARGDCGVASDSRTAETLSADASLIAAAPELLSALVDLWDAAKRTGALPDNCTAFRNASRAIAKAVSK